MQVPAIQAKKFTRPTMRTMVETVPFPNWTVPGIEGGRSPDEPNSDNNGGDNKDF